MSSADIGTRAWWRTLIGLLWLAPLVMALRYWMVWDRLPVRMASHFDAAGRANGWMPREASLYFSVGFVALLTAVFSVTLLIVHRKCPLGKLSWALLAFFHVEIWTMLYMLNSTLDYNLYGSPIAVAPVMVVTPLGLIVVLATAFREKRGAVFPDAEVVAEEVHPGKKWALICLIPMVFAAPSALAVPNFGFRMGTMALCLIFLSVFGMAWDGFHYVFTRHGVEIRSLGIRLKSIPLGDIKHYAIEAWRPACGYGIRGMGNHRAYVWGNSGVRIQLYDGEVFLGHKDPQKIIHDLDVIKQFSHS